MATHSHPCANCQTPVSCDGELTPNHDGWPEVICTTYHRLDGQVQAELCEGCLREDDLRHDADMAENVPEDEA